MRPFAEVYEGRKLTKRSEFAYGPASCNGRHHPNRADEAQEEMKEEKFTCLYV
ncbi:hypothetical protein HY991_02375 [Candidatus Micrarchaeota archaeon]|nr:hypothetical protein [Candidatus Micrarchaeota archaeon]